MSTDDLTAYVRQQTRPPQSSPGRATLGFLAANIHIGAGRTVWPGIVDAAEKRGLNLICFPGGGLHVSEGFEAQRNVIYDLVDATWLAGLVSWSSTISVKLSPAEVVDFHQRFRPLPMVSLAQIIEGVPTLSIDSYHGMRAAIIHLIEAHGYRRLAFIRGPASHFYAQERYRAYADVLHEYGIPFVPELVTHPLNWEAGVEAVQFLLDEMHLRPGVDFQAVVAVSDLLALGAMKALQARGIQIPRDMAIIGFNDSIEGRSVTPPLTSVTMPFYAQGARAIEELAAQLAGEEVPAQVVLQSRLVVRQSCGCPSEAVMQAAAGSVQPSGVDLDLVCPALRAAFLAGLAAIENSGEILIQPAGKLFDAFQIDRVGAEPRGRFLSELENVLEEAARSDRDVAVWQDVLSTMRRRLLPYLTEAERCQAEDLFGQARVVISEAAQRMQAYREWLAERQAVMLREIGQALIMTFNVNKLTDVLAERLPGLGIRSGYLALYENPALSLEQARLVLAYTERGRVTLESGGRRFASHQLVPADLLPQDRQYSLLVEPLYFREEQIGFVVFEIGPRDGALYEVLRGHISSALKGALLF
ncbi:MAG TPA: substrate-binding domain-containing protein, partial [Anaerolineae bacterium]